MLVTIGLSLYTGRAVSLRLRLFSLIEGKDFPTLVKFVEAHPHLVTAKGEMGRTVLHEAARWGNVEALKLFVERGVNVNTTDDWGFTPLHWAVNSAADCMQDAVDGLQYLLLKGADVNVVTSSGLTALHMAASLPGDSTEIMSLLCQAGADVTLEVRDPPGFTAESISRSLEKPSTVEYLRRMREPAQN